jgi:hypothetical protein
MRYATPEVLDYGAISEHTFGNTGTGNTLGLLNNNTGTGTDTFGENSKPGAS